MNYHSVIGNSVNELKSTKLWKRLSNIDPHHADLMVSFVEFIDPFLLSIHKHFPLYTRHDAHHSYEVLERMGTIILPDLLKDTENSLSNDEILCLIVAAYAHDVGMTLFEVGNEKKELLESLSLSEDCSLDDSLLTKYLRSTHAERGVKFLRETDCKQYIPEYLVGIIGNIMKGHNLHPSQLHSNIPDIASIGRITSNPLSLSIVLCCSDALEFSDTRVIDTAFEEAERREDFAAAISIREMMKHRSLGCGISISEEGFIYATGEFPSAEILHATHKSLDQIEIWLNTYLDYDKKQKRQFLRIHNPKINRDSFTTKNFTYYPVAIKMDEFQIREIITSGKMWGGSTSLPIKEIIQNSIDACRYREYLQPKHLEYLPKIEVLFDTEKRIIRITDNGIGMTENDILEYFLQVGRSKARSNFFLENKVNSNFHSLSRYGIGFWSVFSISKRARVSTRYSAVNSEESGLNFEVSIEPLMSFLEILASDISEGTVIEFDLKDGIEMSKLIGELIENMTVSNIPLKFINQMNQVIFDFPTEIEEINASTIFDYNANDVVSNGMKIFSYKEKNDLFDISIGIAYSYINGNPRCLNSSGSPIFSDIPMGEIGNFAIKTSICGLVTYFELDPIPFAIERVGKIIVNIKNPEGLEFSLSRSGLIKNVKLVSILNEVSRSINRALTSFYTNLNAINNPSMIHQLIVDSRSHGGEAGDIYIPNLYNHYKECFPNIVPIKLLKWNKENNGYKLTEIYMFEKEFWEIKQNVYYTYIYAEEYLKSTDFQSYINAILSSAFELEGFILLAFQESIPLIQAANEVSVKRLIIPYSDWDRYKHEVIVIKPSSGKVDRDKVLLSIQSRWYGYLIAIDFGLEIKKPWFSFGRHIIYVNKEHPLIVHLQNITNTGNQLECEKIISLITEDKENGIVEIERITGIKV